MGYKNVRTLDWGPSPLALIRPASSHVEAADTDTLISKPVVQPGRVIFNPGIDQKECVITESLAVLVSKQPRHLVETKGKSDAAYPGGG
jgi:hypothetical protein